MMVLIYPSMMTNNQLEIDISDGEDIKTVKFKDSTYKGYREYQVTS